MMTSPFTTISLGLTCALAIGVNAAEFHIAPNGSDANPGTADKPFATLEKAREAARGTRSQESGARSQNVILLAAGTYRLTRTFELNEKDSGTVFRAAPGADVRLSGGVAIPAGAAKPVADKAVLDRLLPEVQGKVLEIDLKPLGITEFGEIGPRGFRRPYIPAPLELFVDDEPLTLAQWPNPGEPGEPIGKVLDKGPKTRYGEKPDRGGIFEFKTDRPARWTQAKDIWITGLFENGYADNTVQVKAFDLAKKTLTTVQPHMYGFSSGRPWNRWTALNLLEEIDLPGEYMADKASGKLYFLPPNGKDIAKCRLEVSRLSEPMVAIEGATGVVFDGIIFENARGMGIYIERGANNRIQNGALRNLGMVAACIGKGIAPDTLYRHACTGQPVSRALGSWHEHIYDNPIFNRDAGTGHGIVNCQIYNIGAGAISLGGGDRKTLAPAGNFVENCDIHHFNRWDRTYKSAVNIDGVGNSVRHCAIHDCPGSALYLHGNDHVIEFNEIHHALMQGDDMGSFYMGRDPSERGNILRYNYWHDIAAMHNSYCLHFDDAAGDGTLVYGNIFLRAGKKTVINYYGGSDIIFVNNIFIDCPPLLRMSPNCSHRNSQLFHTRLQTVGYDQPLWKKHYPGFENYFAESNQMPRNDLFSKNLFVNTKTAEGKGIVYRDNRETGDHTLFTEVPRLKPGADIGIPGFEPIPFDKIGLQKPAK
jgi:hypothetical protein